MIKKYFYISFLFIIIIIQLFSMKTLYFLYDRANIIPKYVLLRNDLIDSLNKNDSKEYRKSKLYTLFLKSESSDSIKYYFKKLDSLSNKQN